LTIQKKPNCLVWSRETKRVYDTTPNENR